MGSPGNEPDRAASVAGADPEDVSENRGFPPGNPHLLVPARPRSAALAGLSLYDAVTTKQRVVLRLGKVAARGGLVPALPRVAAGAQSPSQEWWQEWLAAVACPVVGPVRFRPRLTSDGRVRCLLLSANGTPLAFAKVVASAEADGLRHEAAVDALLAENRPPRSVLHVPRLLRHGALDGWEYLLFESLPDLGHRPLPGDPRTVARVADAIQSALSGLAGGAGRTDHVPGHGDFTPRNARLTAGGEVWVVDWEYAQWMPRLADELRFWAAQGAMGLQLRRLDSRAQDIFATLRTRGTVADILEAVRWPEYNTPAERAVRDRVEALARDRSS